MIHVNGHFMKLSKSLEKFLGYSTEEISVQPIEKIIINPGSKESGDYIEIPTTNYYFNYCFRCKNGKIKLLRCRLIPDAFEDCIVVLAWEI